MNDVQQCALRRDGLRSEYHWFNVEDGAVRVGKVRALAEGDRDRLTIYSIRIFPDFQGRGYGEAVIERFKRSFDVIVADRVRPRARGFWERQGFISDHRGNYVYDADQAVGQAGPGR